MTDTKQEALSDAKLEEILAGCEDVTPGPWLSAFWPGGAALGPDAGIIQGPRLVQRDKSSLHTPKDAAHIARLDPQTVAALITELLEHRAKDKTDE